MYCINLAINSDKSLQTKVATLSLALSPSARRLITTLPIKTSGWTQQVASRCLFSSHLSLSPSVSRDWKSFCPPAFVHAFRRTQPSVSPTWAPPVNGLHPELRDTLNYRGRPHAAPVAGAVMAVFVYARQMHAHRLFFITVAQKWTSWRGQWRWSGNFGVEAGKKAMKRGKGRINMFGWIKV